jgi:hypothetical protein
MDLDTVLADVAPARHIPLDEPDSVTATALYQRIIAVPPPRARAPRRIRFLALALLTTAAAALAAVVTLALVPGAPAAGPHPARGGPAQLAAWSVARRPDGLVMVTIRELRDPAGLWRMLRADGVPANVRFAPRNFMATTSPSAIPAACRAPHLSNRANALLQAKITPLWPELRLSPGRPGASTGIARDSRPSVVLAIRPSAIPPGIGIYLAAWAASPGTSNGPYLTMQTDLVQVSPKCTGT